MIPKTLEILYFLMSTRSSSKIIQAGFTGDFSTKQLQSKLSRLNKKGLICRDDLGVWETTPKGRSYYKTYTRYKYFDSNLSHKKNARNTLLVFDIPESDRSKRDWLRYQIKKFHYIQIQQSVWYGPSPLPEDFLKYLKKINIQNNIKIFNVSNNKIL